MPTSLGCHAHQRKKICENSQQRGAVVDHSYFMCAHQQSYHEILFPRKIDRNDFKGILMRGKNAISPLNFSIIKFRAKYVVPLQLLHLLKVKHENALPHQLLPTFYSETRTPPQQPQILFSSYKNADIEECTF